MKKKVLWAVGALALGILLARYVPLVPRETLPSIGCLLVLGSLAAWRGSIWIAGTCGLIGFVFAGALTAFAHVPGPPPEIDAEAREIFSFDRAAKIVRVDSDPIVVAPPQRRMRV